MFRLCISLDGNNVGNGDDDGAEDGDGGGGNDGGDGGLVGTIILSICRGSLVVLGSFRMLSTSRKPS